MIATRTQISKYQIFFTFIRWVRVINSIGRGIQTHTHNIQKCFVSNLLLVPTCTLNPRIIHGQKFYENVLAYNIFFLQLLKTNFQLFSQQQFKYITDFHLEIFF